MAKVVDADGNTLHPSNLAEQEIAEPWEPLVEWEEGVTLTPMSFGPAVAIEIRHYASDCTGGDISQAIIELVEKAVGLSG